MTQTVVTLVEIMNDGEALARRRVEAAAQLLEFKASAEIAEMASAYLESVFTDQNNHIELRLDAAKIQRKFEAPKITRPTAAPADDPANREAWRRLELAQRRSALIAAGEWPPEPGWADDLQSSSYRPPPGAGDITDPTNLAKRMKRARERQSR